MFSTIHAKACLAENSRPFFWTGLVCAVYGYLPHALYDAPFLMYFGVCMTAASIGVRVFSAPLVSSAQVMAQVWNGGLPLHGLVKRLSLGIVLIAASLGGTTLLGHALLELAGLG